MSYREIKIDQINTDYIKIKNRKQFLVDIPDYVPGTPRYEIFWTKEIIKCIEGVWGFMEGYRYMPGPLYYYINYGAIKITDEAKDTYFVKPHLRTMEWEYAYMILEARGFSGYSDDDEYTSFEGYNEGRYLVKDIEGNIVYSCYNSKGELKKYRTPKEAIRSLHDKPLGRPLFYNQTKDVLIIGSRGGGKSYLVGIQDIEYPLIFDDAKEYNDDFIYNKLVAEVIIGSRVTSKSDETIEKFIDSQSIKTNTLLGKKWGCLNIRGKANPSLFHRPFSGTTKSGGKYSYKYEVIDNGNKEIKGTGSSLFHVSYSDKKGDGVQSAAGGRKNRSIIEECGLVPNLPEILIENRNIISRDGVRFGIQISVGTSGNIEYVQGSKKCFLNPKDYNIISYTNKDGTVTAFFLPFYLTMTQCTDEDGNIIYEDALKIINKIRKEASASEDPNVLRIETMNRPVFIDEMWQTNKGQYLPYEELVKVEKELMLKPRGSTFKLVWDSNKTSGVDCIPDDTLEPYVEWPILPEKRKNPEAPIIIYEHPDWTKPFPNDLYIIGHDSYVAEDIDRGGSIGSTYVLKNPKYITNGYTGNIIVAVYNSKPVAGLNYYYEQQEKLIQYYGNPQNGLYYEKNRGDDCRNHYIKKNKTYLLAPTPQYSQGNNAYQKNLVSYGYITGNLITKIRLINQIRDWLVDETEFPDGIKKNYERLNDIFLVRQMITYNLDDNFDAVDGFRGCIIGLTEANTVNEVRSNKVTNNSLSKLMQNSKIFKKR